MLGNTIGNRQLHRYYLYLLGIQTSYSAIERALIKAHKANMLFTASASNEGANAPITFPANLPIVICISAADGKGNRSEFTSYKSGVENTVLWVSRFPAPLTEMSASENAEMGHQLLLQ